jgi:hypothetical protein
MIGGNFFLLVTNQRRGKMQVKNDSAELLIFFLHFWVFEVRRLRNPINKISMA